MGRHPDWVQRPRLAQSFEMRPGEGYRIDGEAIPWLVAHEDAAVPMVQRLDEVAHILWLPILIEGPIPGYGSPEDAGAIELSREE